MKDIQIRLGHTDSVNSIDRENFLDVELKNTSKIMHFTDIKETVDKFEQFKKERSNCDRYRVILTINPFCTNVLFNTVTEVVYAEGSENCDAIIESCGFNDDQSPKASKTDNIYGISNPNHKQMVMNTEYSRPGSAVDSSDINGRVIKGEYYEYHPGYDIFNNHILRNNSFKIVNQMKNDDEKNFFNTIGDLMRYPNGDDVTFKRREKLSSDNSDITNRNKHLYDSANILSYKEGDAINANLIEENGWYGFINSSMLQSKFVEKQGTVKSIKELGIEHILNYKKSCEFVDMYPDRTLYSFNPKYNKYKHREEHNWEILLTYPYERCNDYEILPKFNTDLYTGLTGLLVLSVKKIMGANGRYITMIRSLTKHGLNRGDYFRMYYAQKSYRLRTDPNTVITEDEYSRLPDVAKQQYEPFVKDDETWTQYDKDFIVTNIGDLRGRNKEYYFYIEDDDFIAEKVYYRLKTNPNYIITENEYNSLDEMYKPLYERVVEEGDITSLFANCVYRFSRLVGNIPSEYYIRKFRKLPNFKYAKSKYTEDSGQSINDYISENSRKDGKYVLYDKEQYKLGFESTIYTDDSTQVVFTDTIDIGNLVDDRGCPITEIYATIVKANYGHESWYDKENPKYCDWTEVVDDKEVVHRVEYSHCFGKISSGLRFSQQIDDPYKRETSDKNEPTFYDIRGNYGDVCIISHQLESCYETDITLEQDEFLGDITEFNPRECIEKPIQTFMHRFNTAQRELNTGEDGDITRLTKVQQTGLKDIIISHIIVYL